MRKYANVRMERTGRGIRREKGTRIVMMVKIDADLVNVSGFSFHV